MRGYDWLLVAGVVLLLFGGTQIPKLARSLGQASKEFKKGQDQPGDEVEKKDVTKKEGKAE